MVRLLANSKAFGAPGLAPRWTHSDKVGIGTAYSTSSHIWFTVWNGILTEVYYPTVDRPQIRDLQYLITDGRSFFHTETRDLQSVTEQIDPKALGYRTINRDPEGRYTLTKETISDPHLPCILQRTHVTGDPEILSHLQLYALCAPHLNVGGWGNTAQVVEVASQKLLIAQKDGVWMAMGATVPFRKLSCGYVGQSDGWQDLNGNWQLDWQFDIAEHGNVALTGELDWQQQEFVLGLAFGASLSNAVSTLFQSLEIPFEQQQHKFKTQWQQAYQGIHSLEVMSSDSGNLYTSSVSLILGHEDKLYPGAIIASMTIPWGEAKGDADTGGYHLVWTRDLVNSVMGLMAAGDTQVALRSLIYLATNQQHDGRFAQNFWIDGTPYWTAIQLDEVAFPILLAHKVCQQNVPLYFDFYPMVLKAASYLIRFGPATQQERWEENSGYSPSTLATTIAALIAAAEFARSRGDVTTAEYTEDYADFLESHLEAWTVTTAGTLVPDIPRHYIRISPARPDEPYPYEGPNNGTIQITSAPPDARSEFPAKEIVDTGFLQLVRYGIRRADDPLIVASVKVLDTVLKTDTPFGPGWHRYNHDHYGQRADGGPYKRSGEGRIWPLLTGERGHYELAMGNDVQPYIQAMEGFATQTGLLPEQVWDQADRPDDYLYLGRPTGSAMPLLWAHSEYIKLLRSAKDQQVFDYIPAVGDRYLGDRSYCKRLEIWKFNYQVKVMQPGQTLRIQATHPFRLHWSTDRWQTVHESSSQYTALQIEYADIAIAADQHDPIQFTFFWTESNTWEQRNYQVEVQSKT